MIVLALLIAAAAGARAQDIGMRVFVSRGALEERTAAELTALLGRTFSSAQWTLEMEDGQTLRELVMDDCAPQIAICAPGEALPWAKAGLLLPLTGAVGGQKLIEPRVLSCCVEDERLFMAPLAAAHRKMAINRSLLEEKRLGYLISAVEHPVWYLSQFQQLMEEFALSDVPAFEIWPGETEDSGGAEALVQALFGGVLLSEDGETCRADSPEIRAGVKWLRDMLKSGLIACAEDRETALQRFIDGKTPVFIDWTKETQRRYAGAVKNSGMELITMPYPCASGTAVRSFELTGAAAFEDEDVRKNDLALKAIAFLHEGADAQEILGERAIRRDEAVWLPCLSADSRGATLRMLFAGALSAVLTGGADEGTALAAVQAMMDAAGQR